VSVLFAFGERFGHVMHPRLQRIREWARAITRDVVALGLAVRDPRVPWYAKAVAACVVAYALSPIDLIPDFVPVLGYLDDLVIVPLGIVAAVKLIPGDVMQELRDRARLQASTASHAGAAFVVLVWIAVTIGIAVWLWPRLHAPG
jgi:uncharacterized membrane protein YkvA (DUF1232 family)